MTTTHRHRYEVVVGNVGQVCPSDATKAQALDLFDRYRLHSLGEYGRVGGEDVTLLCDGEPIKEHVGTLHLDD